MRINLKTLLITTTGLITAMGTPSYAADTGLEEIIVTANKRSQNMQDVAISVTAFTAQALRDQGVNRIENFADFIPNVHYNVGTSIRNTEITIRGIKSDANSIGVEQASGVYVDGVYMGRPTMINVGIFDLERVEVLRGPQGTLYGKNTVAGAINFITQKPTNELGGEALLSYGNYNRFVAYGMVNLPLEDGKSALRLSAQTEQRDGYFTNLAGPDLVDANNYNVHGTLSFTPNENTTIYLRGDYARDRTRDGASELEVVSPLFSGPPFNVTPGTEFFIPDDGFDRVVSEDDPPFQDRDVWGGSLEVNWQLGNGGTITSLSAYRGFTWDNFQSSDNSPFDIFGTGIKEFQNQVSQEFRYVSPESDTFEYIAGLYYFRMNLRAEPIAFIGEDILALFGAPLGSFPGGDTGKLLPDIDVESYAAFAHVTYHVNEKFDIIGGIRFTHETKAITFSTEADDLFLAATNALFGGFGFNVVPPVAEKDFDRADSVFTGNITLNYKPNEDVLVYGGYARGYKAGGYNAFDFDLANDDGTAPEFEPEFADSFEIGVKTTFMEGKARLNIAAYYINYKDLQVVQRLELPNQPIIFRTSNAAKANNKGFEIELDTFPAEGLQISAGLGYTDATYDEFIIDALDPVNGDLSGNDLVSSPDFTGNIVVQYIFPVAESWDMRLRGEYAYRGSTFSDQVNTLELINESYSIFNARVALLNDEKGIEIAVWGRNLFDKDYTTSRGFGSNNFAPGSKALLPGVQRTYGIDVRFSF